MFQLDSTTKLLRVKNWENDKRQSREGLWGWALCLKYRGARQ